jgi:RNA polymerase sigma-70 factor (ECF subfamily)
MQTTFDQIYAYRSRLKGSLHKMLCNPDDVDDVLIDAYVTAYTALPAFRGDSNVYTWLYRIAKNKAMDHLRKLQTIKEVEPFDITYNDGEPVEKPEPVDTVDPLQELLRAELRGEIRRAYRALPPPQRRVVWNMMFLQRTQEETACILNIPQGTVKSRLFRGQEKMRVMLRGYVLSS